MTELIEKRKVLEIVDHLFNKIVEVDRNVEDMNYFIRYNNNKLLKELENNLTSFAEEHIKVEDILNWLYLNDHSKEDERYIKSMLYDLLNNKKNNNRQYDLLKNKENNDEQRY